MQGWRSGMEDAHLTVSDLFAATVTSSPSSCLRPGVEEAAPYLASRLGQLSLFAVFDGHGGHEVAQFCRHHFPGELRRQLSKGLPVDVCEGSNNFRSTMLGEVLRNSFHAMDDMLRQPEYEQELLVLKREGANPGCSSTRSPDALDSAAGACNGTKEASESKATAPRATVVSLLRSSIQGDVAQARDRGSLTKQEATQVMMKMNLLKRLEGEEGSGGGGGANSVGCTAVCVLLSNDEIVCANAGDSRAVLSRNGTAVELSHDHKPNDERERQRIEAAGGRVEEVVAGSRVHYRINGNLNLSRAIGDLEFKQQPDLGPEVQIVCSTPDIVHMPLTKDDEFIVLACDGVWDVKTNQEVIDFIRSRLRQGKAIPQILEALLDDCIADNPKETNGLGGDNMTCIIVKLLQEGTGL